MVSETVPPGCGRCGLNFDTGLSSREHRLQGQGNAIGSVLEAPVAAILGAVRGPRRDPEGPPDKNRFPSAALHVRAQRRGCRTSFVCYTLLLMILIGLILNEQEHIAVIIIALLLFINDGL